MYTAPPANKASQFVKVQVVNARLPFLTHIAPPYPWPVVDTPQWTDVKVHCSTVMSGRMFGSSAQVLMTAPFQFQLVSDQSLLLIDSLAATRLTKGSQRQTPNRETRIMSKKSELDIQTTRPEQALKIQCLFIHDCVAQK